MGHPNAGLAGVDDATTGRVQDRDPAASKRDHVADERDHIADERERMADERERIADARETGANAREQRLDVREERVTERGRHLRIGQQDRVDLSLGMISRAREALERSRAHLDRSVVALEFFGRQADRQQAEIDRETERSGPERDDA
jgi:hypothetical protein